MLPQMLRGPGLAALVALAGCGSKAPPQPPMNTPAASDPVTLDSLTPGREVDGFRAEAVYLDDKDARMGARLTHLGTGFTFDVVFIESAPQAFVWVNSFPTSDMGEPHTQEHLLLGKGNKGRWVAGLESMSLAESSAFTKQWRTCYHFHTIAGVDVFWNVFDHKLDGLLHPDYSDEEIRREVRNFGVALDAKTGTLRLEEKGTVYNEMVRSFEGPNRLLWRTIGQLQYGPTHPLALSSGGFPAAIRKMTAADIRTFHDDHYHLANMGMVAAFPRTVALDTILKQTDGILTRQNAGAARGAVTTEADLPAPKSAPPGRVELVHYAYSNAQEPGTVMLAWPPALHLSVKEELLLQLFLDNVAGDSTTELYKALVDSKRRQLDVGATGVWSYMSSDQGDPIYMGVSGVRTAELTEKGVDRIRALILAQLSKIAAMPDGSPELAAFNERLRNRVTETRRGLAKFMNSPPGFGYRGSGSGWMNHLHDLARESGFEKSLTMKPEIAFVLGELGKKGNVWKGYLARWKLTETEPYAGASVADPTLLERENTEREGRIRAELDLLKKKYGASDDATTIADYKADYDKATAALEQAGKSLTLPHFIDTPPMTLDDALVWKSETISGAPMVRSTFESMTGGTVGAAFDLHGVPENRLIYLSVLAPLMTRVGVIVDGVPISHEQVTEHLRAEVLAAGVYLTSNKHSGRVELVGRGSGNDAGETRQAITWVRRFLDAPDWRPENLPRIRDVVDQMAKGLRRRMNGAEEGWVADPATIWDYQSNPLLAHTSSFLTRAHDVHRLRWLLRAASGPKAPVFAFLHELAGAGGSGRKALAAMLAAPADGAVWPKTAHRARDRYLALTGDDEQLADDALSDLGELLGNLPDDSLAGDWRYLCEEIGGDLATDPAQVLKQLDEVRVASLHRGSMRLFAIGSTPVEQATAGDIEALVAGVPEGAAPAESYSTERFIEARLRQRVPGAKHPLFVGLVNRNTQSGVFVNSAPGWHYSTRDDDGLLRYLASNLYTGHGAHSIFMKTWSAGLAYSNGLRGSLPQERIKYYAERCPELPQTLRFVIGELKKAKEDPTLVDYAVAQSFSSRVAGSFEGRGEQMAADLTDGVTPEMVRGFREKLMALRTQHGDQLPGELFTRMPEVYGMVLPGYGPKSADVPGAVYFVIGPESQLDKYQEYLTAVEGPDAVLYRLYPRDFWVPRAGGK